MITFFRNLFSSKLGLFLVMCLVGLIAFAFAFADISAPTNMFGSNGATIATVDGNDIDDERISRIMNRALQNQREQTPGVDMAAFIDAGGLDQTIDQYVNDQVLRAFAEDHGLLISKRLIDAAISQVPVFQGLTGQFDETTFRQVIAQQGLSEDEVRDDFIRQTLLDVLLGPIGAATVVPAEVARPYVALQLEQRRGFVAAVPSAAMPAGDDPTAAEVTSFYEENVSRYTLPERRSFRFAVFSLDGLAIPEPTDEQITAYYDDNADSYGGTQSRNFQQIILPDEASAEAFHAAVEGGADFAAEAQERGFSASAIQVNDQTEAAFGRTTSAAISAAAFAADRGDLLDPQQSGLGWHVVRVAAITSRDATPLSAVRSEIIEALRVAGGNDQLAQFYLDIENAIDSGASFEEVVDDKNLTIQSTPLLAPNGLSPEQPAFRPSPELGPLLEAAFSLGEDEDAILVPLVENQRYALLDVTEVARTAPQSLDAIRELVEQQFRLDRASRQARTIADEIIEKFNNGTALSQAIAEAGVTLPPPQPAGASRLAISQPGANVPEPIRLLFRMAENTAKLVRLPQDQGWFIVILESIETEAEAITDALVESARGQFAATTSQEYAEQFLNAVRADYPVARDEEAIQALAGRLTGRTR